MLSIPAGRYPVWPDFSLELSSTLEFEPSFHYYLCGPNGSGKSSFIKKLLLPALQHTPGIYFMYWEQQIALQSFAIKAHAAFAKHTERLESDADCLFYLLDDLRQSLRVEKRPAFFVVDECLLWGELRAFLETHQLPLSLIFTHHDPVAELDKLNYLHFESVSAQLGIVSESKP